jgi:hypothetical protein
MKIWVTRKLFLLCSLHFQLIDSQSYANELCYGFSRGFPFPTVQDDFKTATDQRKENRVPRKFLDGRGNVEKPEKSVENGKRRRRRKM